MPDYHPPTTPWEMSSVITNLLTLSLYLLKPEGRLSFFLPSDNADFKDIDIPVLDGLKLISVSSQSFGKWSRRLVTMEKVEKGVNFEVVGERGIPRDDQEAEVDVEGLTLKEEDDEGRKEGAMPGTTNFREKYFAKFGQQAKERVEYIPKST